jgi:cleavage and polyadenylation specificity factor subunit 2
VTFDVREEAVGLGQPDAVAKYGIGESIGGLGDNVVEDDYGISVKAESFVDIVTGVDPSKFAGGTGRIGEEVTRRGLGFGVDGKPAVSSGGGGDGDNVLNEGEDEGMNEKMLEVADLSSGKGIIRGRNGRQPIKVSVIPRRLELLAEIVYVPLEGRVDARAARQQVRALQPRHLVIIGGSKSNSFLLGDALRSSGPSAVSSDNNAVHIPSDGETIQLTVGHAAYPVRLLDTPYLTQIEKEEMEAQEKEIEPVEPYEAKIGECTVSLVDFVATGKKWAVDGSLVLAPRRQVSSLKQPSLMLSAREVLLTDLRSEVIALGMKAEYSALSGYSQLIINGKIFVRKENTSGKLDVEGPLCEDFFRVRSLVSSQFVTL